MRVDYDGVDDGAISLILKTSSLTDSLTNAAQIMIELMKLELVVVLVASWSKSCQKSKNCYGVQKLQRSEKFAKTIGLKELLPKH